MHAFKFHRGLSLSLFYLLVGLVLHWTTTSTAVAKAKGPAFQAQKGSTMYTQFSLYYEKGCHITTNYRRGALLPVNTQLTFVKASGSKIFVLLPNGEKIFLQNVPEFSGEDINGIFSRTLSTTQVDLGKFTEEERKSILAGRVTPGMSKAAVLVAIGYPPKHKTPTLDLDQWRYWSNRFGTFLVHFEADKVARIQN